MTIFLNFFLILLSAVLLNCGDPIVSYTPPNDLLPDPSLPPAPTPRLTLSWMDRSDNEDGFRIERRRESEITYQELTTVGPNTTNYVDSSVENGTIYCYRVLAYNFVGVSDYTNEACAMPTTSQVEVVDLAGR